MARIVFALIVLTLHEPYCEFPSSIPRCPRDGTLDTCLQKTLEDIKPLLVSGDFGDGFVTPPLDPIESKGVNISTGLVEGKFEDLKSFGISSYTVKSVTSNLRKMSFEMNLIVPQIRFEGRYKSAVKALKMDILGEGDLKGRLSDVAAKIHFQFGIELVDEEQFVRYKSVSVKLKVADLELDWTNELNRDPAINNLAKELVNAKKLSVLETIIPIWEESSEKKLDEILRVLFRSCKFNEFFA